MRGPLGGPLGYPIGDDVETLERLWKRWGGPLIALALILVFSLVICFASVEDTPLLSTKPVKVEGEDALHIKDAYNQMTFATQSYQLAILNAKVNLSIPKGWDFNLSTFSFEPPSSPSPSSPPSPPKEIPQGKEKKP